MPAKGQAVTTRHTSHQPELAISCSKHLRKNSDQSASSMAPGYRVYPQSAYNARKWRFWRKDRQTTSKPRSIFMSTTCRSIVVSRPTDIKLCPEVEETIIYLAQLSVWKTSSRRLRYPSSKNTILRYRTGRWTKASDTSTTITPAGECRFAQNLVIQ